MSELFTYTMQGDCLERMKEIPDDYVDMILCDLPYGITKCKWDAIIQFEPLWQQYERICKGAVVLTASQPFTSALVMSNLKAYKYQWVWRKDAGTGFLNAKKQPLRDVEDILIFYDKQCLYNPQMRTGFKPYKQKKGSDTDNYRPGLSNDVWTESAGERYPKTLLEFKRDKNKLHPTQKPVALMEYLIKTYTNENMIVLDNCMGSGTTGVACVNTNRSFIGIEQDQSYFQIACKRIEDARAALVVSKKSNWVGAV